MRSAFVPKRSLFWLVLILTTLGHRPLFCHENGKQNNSGSGKDDLLRKFGAKICQIKDPAAGEEEHRRPKREVYSVIILVQMVSTLIGSLTNDIMMASWWQKLNFCVQTLWERRLRGWKRCWDFARLGEQKWRTRLKPHLLAQMIRIIRLELHRLDSTGVIYKRAMEQIQKKFEGELLLDGSQFLHLVDLMRNAGLALPGIPLAMEDDRMPPMEVAKQMGKMTRLDAIEQFRATFTVQNEVLALLRSDLAAGNREQFGASFLKVITIGGVSTRVQPNWAQLAGMENATQQFAREFTVQLNKGLLTEAGQTEANQLFLHAVVALYARAMFVLMHSDTGEGVGAKLGTDETVLQQMESLARCLHELSRDEQRFGIFEGRPPEEMSRNNNRQQEQTKGENNSGGEGQKLLREFVILKNDVNITITGIVDELDIGASDLEGIGRRFYEKFKPLLKDAKFRDPNLAGQSASDAGECEYAKGALLAESFNKMNSNGGEGEEEVLIGNVGMVRRREGKGGKQLLIVLLDEQGLAETEKEKGLVAALARSIQRDYFPGQGKGAAVDGRSQTPLENGESESEEYNANMVKVSGLEMRAKLAAIGLVIGQDMEENKEELNKLTRRLGLPEIGLDEGEKAKFKAIVKEALVKSFDILAKYGTDKFKGIKKFMGAMADIVGALKPANWKNMIKMVTNREKWDLEQREKAFAGAVEDLVRKVGAEMGTTLVDGWEIEPGLVQMVPVRMEKKRVEQTLRKVESELLQQENVAHQHFQQNGHGPRKKRGNFAIDFGWGMLTGFVGNWLSEYIDLSRTLRNWLFRWDHRIVLVEDVKRKQRQRAMMNFVQSVFKILLINLARGWIGAQQCQRNLEQILSDRNLTKGQEDEEIEKQYRKLMDRIIV